MAFDPQGTHTASYLRQEAGIIAFDAAQAALWNEFGSIIQEAAAYIKQAPKWMDRDNLIALTLEEMGGVNSDNYEQLEALLKEWSA